MSRSPRAPGRPDTTVCWGPSCPAGSRSTSSASRRSRCWRSCTSNNCGPATQCSSASVRSPLSASSVRIPTTGSSQAWWWCARSRPNGLQRAQAEGRQAALLFGRLAATAMLLLFLAEPFVFRTAALWWHFEEAQRAGANRELPAALAGFPVADFRGLKITFAGPTAIASLVEPGLTPERAFLLLRDHSLIYTLDVDPQTKCDTGYVRGRHGNEIQPPHAWGEMPLVRPDGDGSELQRDRASAWPTSRHHPSRDPAKPLC